MSKAKSKASWV